MTTSDETWAAMLRAAVDDDPRALMFDPSTYVAEGRKRMRRKRVRGIVAVAASVATILAIPFLTDVGNRDGATEPVAPHVPETRPAPNGWVAYEVNDERTGSRIHLSRPGSSERALDVDRAGTGSDACAAWSPDGTQLVLGRISGTRTAPEDPELVVVPVNKSGDAGSSTVIGLGEWQALEGFDPHPCGIWSPNGRWIALAGNGEVWVVDTADQSIRRLPDLRPSDLEWRPGTDELTIAGDIGTDRSEPTLSAQVRTYSMARDQLVDLGTVEAAHITWSPDGSTLAYTGGEEQPTRLRLVDGDGGQARTLVESPGEAVHGAGPFWSPTGEWIAYHRTVASYEPNEIVLVDPGGGDQKVVDATTAEGDRWYPYAASWSPDGTTLVYSAWSETDVSAGGVITVPVDGPEEVRLLAEGGSVGSVYDHQWTPTQMWGRQPD